MKTVAGHVAASSIDSVRRQRDTMNGEGCNVLKDQGLQ
jgi:hypothetical protein